MKVVIFGASGMIGSGALLECLDDRRVESVLVVGRRGTGRTHPKLEEIVHSNFFDYSDITDRFTDRDACFFCLGVSSAGMSEADYSRVTYDLTLAAANAMATANPRMTFCYFSGVGTDSSEQGRVMWARVKGRTENALLRLFTAAYMFRPGYIQPLRGVRSSTPLYQGLYTIVAPLYPLLRRVIPKQLTTTVAVGRALIQVAAVGYGKHIIDVEDINRLAAAAPEG
ncbi:MAG TPA: NAD-dependent epimerase/dehydratase family protein [Gemmatimonadaceae bacterium]|nr:NAD-dependent epimerase/dehydratase family protein [Gemmatimonadaceae bacterium]